MTRPPFGRLHLYPLQVKSASDQAFQGWASTPTVDREGEVVLPEALAAALRDYMRNPIVTYAHDWLNPIGRTVEARATEAGLWVQMQLGRTARAREVWQLVEDRILRSLSIGFNAGPEDGFERDGLWYWRRIELLEIAVVPIPANPNAVISMARHLGLDPRSPIAVQKARQAEADRLGPPADHQVGGVLLPSAAPAEQQRPAAAAPSGAMEGATPASTKAPAPNLADAKAGSEAGQAAGLPVQKAHATTPDLENTGQDEQGEEISAEALLAALLEHLDPQTLARLVGKAGE